MVISLDKVFGKEFPRVMRYMKPRMGKYFTGMLMMSVLFSAISVVESYTLKSVIEAAEFRQISTLIEGIRRSIYVVLAVVIIEPIFGYMYTYCANVTVAEVRLDVFRFRSKLPMGYFETTHSGDTISRMVNDLNGMGGIYSARLRRLIYPFIYGTAAAIPMFILHWQMALALLILNSLCCVINFRFIRPMRKISNRIQENTSVATQRLVDMLAGFHIMKVFNIESGATTRYSTANDQVAGHIVKREYMSAILNGINYLIRMLSSIGVLTIGAFLVSRGVTSFGTLFAIMNLQGRLISAFLQVSNYLPEVQGMLASASRLFTFLDSPVEPERYETEHIVDENVDIGLRNVSFRYRDGVAVLDGLTLTAAPGQTIALVGPSGQGKSTIIKLLLGFYPPESGNIIIRGKSLGQYTLRDLRRLIGYVQQDPYIFDVTIEENIRYGRADATDREVQEAAIAAYAHAFIMEQPDGYKTLVGERGIKLSGGQKQRIAIARALLKNAPILLLDEATSSLDSESEQQVQKALETLAKGRTTLVIAHRLSTIENADMIYVIVDGKVTEQGTHNDLITNDGVYRSLYYTQFR